MYADPNVIAVAQYITSIKMRSGLFVLFCWVPPLRKLAGYIPHMNESNVRGEIRTNSDEGQVIRCQ